MKTHPATSTETAVATIPQPSGGRIVTAEQFMPIFSKEQIVARKESINYVIDQTLREGVDYGKMPGNKRRDDGEEEKKVLLKPGAEKLCTAFGLTPFFRVDKEIEDWLGQQHGEPLFYYKYTCELWRGDIKLGEAIGSCNSWESKYRYRWLGEEQAEILYGSRIDRFPQRGGVQEIFEPNFALQRQETTGQYGKPIEYWAEWSQAISSGEAFAGKKLMGKREHAGYFRKIDRTMYRCPNPDIADVINTVQKIAQKRALVAAVLIVTNCSDRFTQDLEETVETEDHPTTATAPAAANGSAAPEPHGEPAESPAVDFATMPAELSAWIQDMRKGKKVISEVLTWLEKQVVAAAGEGGLQEFERLRRVASSGSFRTKEEATEHAIGIWVQMWGLVLKARNVKAQEQGAAMNQEQLPIEDEPLP